MSVHTHSSVNEASVASSVEVIKPQKRSGGDASNTDLGVKAGLVEKSGSWFSYDSVRIGQGRENAKVYLRENPDVAQRIENAIRGRTEEVGEALMVGPVDETDEVGVE